MAPKIIAFSGSIRKDSFNRKLIAAAARTAKELGAEVTLIDLKEYPFPLYDGDLETAEGLPQNVVELKNIFQKHDAFLIASPEYNSSISPLLKNTIDWLSRPSPKDVYTGKIAALLSASPGKLGGLRGLVHVRGILETLGVMVIPEQFALASAHQAFEEAGKLKDESQLKIVESVCKKLIDVTSKLKIN